MDWGMDGLLYVADTTGGHIVRVGNDGPMDDLGWWQTLYDFQRDGPMGVAVDSDGIVYAHNHANIFRSDLDGELSDLRGIVGAPVGGIAVGLDNELYYTDRSDSGGIYLWNPSGYSEKIADLPYANGLAVGLDGMLYAGQFNHDRVVQIDVAKKEAFDFVSVYTGPELIFLDVGSDGNIWARTMGALHQYTPEGTEVPFTVDGESYPGGRNIWDQAAGIACDGSGNLWSASVDSRLLRLELMNETEGVKHFSSTLVAPGLEGWDLAAGPAGEVYSTDLNRNELLLFRGTGEPEVLATLDQEYSAVAVDPTGAVYFSMPNHGEIMKLESDLSTTVYASLWTKRMVFADDGNLYALTYGVDGLNTIVRIEGANEISIITDSIDGISLGSGALNLCAAKDQGLYLYTEPERDLFLMNYDGTGHLVANLGDLTHPQDPSAMACSPTSGDVYLVLHGPSTGYRIDADGNITEFARGLFGDPWGAAISHDGNWLYVAESGAIDMIPLTEN
jgi:sugar lactone lactonase YvrE